MKVTEVRVKLNLSSTDRLRGFCSITLDNAFAVRDIKIIDGPGGLFVAMPSRKLMDHCPRCRGKNHVKARYCNTCGSPLPAGREAALDDGRSKLHCDVAHPINAATRLAVQEAIIRASAAAPSISWVDRASLPDGGTADPYLCPGGESQILASVPAAAERLGQLQGCMPLSGLGHRLNTPIQRVVLVLLGSREVAVANWIYGEHEGQADGTIVFSDGQSFEVHVAR